VDTSSELIDLALDVVERHRKHLVDAPFNVQVGGLLQRLERIHCRSPLTVPTGTHLDLNGFGSVLVRVQAADDSFVLASDVAEALGWTALEAWKWARDEYRNDVERQRRADEDRDDGLLGWEHVSTLYDTGLILEAPDDGTLSGPAGALLRRHGDFLIAGSRVPNLSLASPRGSDYFRRLHGRGDGTGESSTGWRLRGPVVPTEDG